MSTDAKIAIGILIATAGAFLWTLSFPHESAVWPRGILIIIFSLAVILLVMNLGRKPADESAADPRSEFRNPYFLFTLVFIPAYIYLISVFGYYVATWVFFTVFMWVLGQRRKTALLLLSSALVLILFIVITVVMRIPVPVSIFW